MSITKYIENALTCSQTQVSADDGFQNPDIITMFKQGITRIPLEKVPALASALDVDALDLLGLCLTEYRLERKTTLQNIYGIDFGHRDLLEEIA